jgi:hypothetical protein
MVLIRRTAAFQPLILRFGHRPQLIRGRAHWPSVCDASPKWTGPESPLQVSLLHGPICTLSRSPKCQYYARFLLSDVISLTRTSRHMSRYKIVHGPSTTELLLSRRPASPLLPRPAAETIFLLLVFGFVLVDWNDEGIRSRYRMFFHAGFRQICIACP